MSMTNEMRQKLERAIVTALVEECRKAGFVPVTVWDGGSYEPQGWSRAESERRRVCEIPLEKVIEHVFSVDESTLHFAPASSPQKWGTLGVALICGNGKDIISDYHCWNTAFDAAVTRAYKRFENVEVRL